METFGGQITPLAVAQDNGVQIECGRLNCDLRQAVQYPAPPATFPADFWGVVIGRQARQSVRRQECVFCPSIPRLFVARFVAMKPVRRSAAFAITGHSNALLAERSSV